MKILSVDDCYNFLKDDSMLYWFAQLLKPYINANLYYYHTAIQQYFDKNLNIVEIECINKHTTFIYIFDKESLFLLKLKNDNTHYYV